MEYDKKILRKLQLTQLEMLKDIDVFCEQNVIPYFIAYGTALGAVRHGGFIPWDDDIDICMRRDHYEKFVKLAKKKMNDKYDILNIQETKGYLSVFCKVSKKGTKFIEAEGSNDAYEQGIFIDVFPFDYAPSDPEKRKKVFQKAWFWVRVCMLCEISEPIIPSNVKGVKRVCAKAACKMAHYFFKLIRCDKIKAYQKYLKYSTAYGNQEKDGYLADYQALRPESTLLRESDIYPTKKIVFEGCEFPVPANLEKHLSEVYGDYMQLPPEDQRHNHMAKILEFGDEE